MNPSKYFSDDDSEDEDIIKAREEGYKSGVREMYNNIQMVATLCDMFPVQDKLEMFLAIIRDL